MSADTIWLASYPKSGNTWMRAILQGLRIHRLLFDANSLGHGAQPYHVGSASPAFGLDARWLSRGELDQVRDSLVRRERFVSPAPPPPDETEVGDLVFRKTHELYRPGPPGAEPFPTAATAAAILVVRDPRDVACSYAPFFGYTLDEAVERMAETDSQTRAHPSNESTAQPWGSWSSHSESWLSPDVPFPVHVVRYEDLKRDAVETLLPVLAAVGRPCAREDLAAAVAQAAFERLQEWETTRRFREVSSKTERFFRSGRSGGWREGLTPGQVRDLETDHVSVMERFGYELTTTEQERHARAEARRSRRRQAATDWWEPPASLGLEVEVGTVPVGLAGAESPRPWIQVAPDQALLRFQAGAGLWVRDGRQITVELGEPDEAAGDIAGDASWIIQGWGVTLAVLQRGGLSLHAATVQIGDRVVALAGRRGAGKSTTSMALRRAGHQLLIDDVTLVEADDDGVWVTPYSRNVHLLPDAAAALGLDFDELPLLAGARAKAAFRAEHPSGERVRLDEIVVLQRVIAGDAVVRESLRGRRRVAALLPHTERDGVAPLVLGGGRYFERVTQLASRVPVSVIRRPTDDWTLEEVVRLVVEGAADPV